MNAGYSLHAAGIAVAGRLPVLKEEWRDPLRIANGRCVCLPSASTPIFEPSIPIRL